MGLYIEVQNGQPVNHPATEENLMQAFQCIPAHWEPFKRIDAPMGKITENVTANPYQKIDGFWQDSWVVTQKTPEELETIKQAIIDDFNNREQAENWSAWIFEPTTWNMVPPIPRPERDEAKLSQNIYTFWCGADNNWKDTPARPEGNYKFDFIAWTWVEVTA